jgi:hypothetical protein
MNELLFLVRIAAVLAVIALIGLVVWRKRPHVVAMVCAHLGLADDPFGHEKSASEAHRCYANLGRERIDLLHQQRFCLASTHNRCPFLMVTPQQSGWQAQMRSWWRSVSPAARALAARLGHTAEPVSAATVTQRALVYGQMVLSMLGVIGSQIVMRLRALMAARSTPMRAPSWSQLSTRLGAVARTAHMQPTDEQDAVEPAVELSAPLAVLLAEPEPPRVQAVVPADPRGPGRTRSARTWHRAGRSRPRGRGLRAVQARDGDGSQFTARMVLASQDRRNPRRSGQVLEEGARARSWEQPDRRQSRLGYPAAHGRSGRREGQA